MFFDRIGQLVDLNDAAPACLPVPVCEPGLGLWSRSGEVDVLQVQLVCVGLGALQVLAVEWPIFENRTERSSAMIRLLGYVCAFVAFRGRYDRFSNILGPLHLQPHP